MREFNIYIENVLNPNGKKTKYFQLLKNIKDTVTPRSIIEEILKRVDCCQLPLTSIKTCLCRESACLYSTVDLEKLFHFKDEEKTITLMYRLTDTLSLIDQTQYVIELMEIKNFCNFKEMSIEFSLYDQSPLTILTGPNNSGKTNLCKALWLWNTAYQKNKNYLDNKDKHYLNSSEIPFSRPNDLFLVDTDPIYISLTLKNTSSNAILKITYSFRLSRHDILFQREGEITTTDLVYPPLVIVYIPHDGFASISAHESFSDWDGHESTLYAHPIKNLRRLCWLLEMRYPESWSKIKLYMKDSFHIELLSCEIVDHDKYRLLYSTNKKKLEVASLGGRAIRNLATIVALCLSRSNVVCLDEPDSNLLQFSNNSGLEWDTYIADRQQVLIVTHSEQLISKISNYFTTTDNVVAKGMQWPFFTITAPDQRQDKANVNGTTKIFVLSNTTITEEGVCT